MSPVPIQDRGTSLGGAPAESQAARRPPGWPGGLPLEKRGRVYRLLDGWPTNTAEQPGGQPTEPACWSARRLLPGL